MPEPATSRKFETEEIRRGFGVAVALGDGTDGDVEGEADAVEAEPPGSGAIVALGADGAAVQPVISAASKPEARTVERRDVIARGLTTPALGADEFVGLPQLGHRYGVRQGETGGKGSLAEISRIDVAVPPDPGGHQPDVPAVGEVGERIDQAVTQVAVLVAPPQQHHVNGFDGFVDEVLTEGLMDGRTKLLIGVVIPTKFLNSLTLGNAQGGDNR